MLPGEFALRQNYPNPFNPSTTVRFDLPLATSVRLAVYDLLGREVLRLVDGHLEAGYHQRVWIGRDRDGREVPTGIYFVRLVTGEFSAVRKMILMK
ncbi:MAG: T9SS type A sorting domain-containing protein [Candidatus Marinimicrobia bacterium]|nr:T9SS type A sorting domain-containing protein [Candidatus Neomarinimicrobiota bacterium]